MHGNYRWHSIYIRPNRRARQGVLDRVFLALQENDVLNIQVDHVSLNSTSVKVHPDGTGALKKTVLNLSASPEEAGPPIHMVAAGHNRAVAFSLSPGQAGDAPEGRKLLKELENCGWEDAKMIMDKADEGDKTRQLVFELGMALLSHPRRTA